MPTRDIAVGPFAPSVKERLQRAGFRTVADVAELTPVQLSHGTAFTPRRHALWPRYPIFIRTAPLLPLAPPSHPTELGCTPDEALAIVAAAQRANTDEDAVPTGVSAVDLLRREAALPLLHTGCAGLDALLGGGIPAGKLTEFCGAPGVGKTQLGYAHALRRSWHRLVRAHGHSDRPKGPGVAVSIPQHSTGHQRPARS